MRDQAADLPGVRTQLGDQASRTDLRNDSFDTFAFDATEQIASYCATNTARPAHTNATARSRTSREYLIFPAMIHLLTSTRSPRTGVVQRGDPGPSAYFKLARTVTAAHQG
jgi:hypothetical protein